MNPLIFREYDIRGIAATDLGDDEVHTLGRACGSRALDSGADEFVVGRDVRLSGPRVERAFTDGLLASGVNVISIGVVPTPVFYYALNEVAPAGAMITASHNPPEYNGFKVGYDRTTIYGAEIQRLRESAASGRFRTGRGTRRELDVIPDYLAMCRRKVTIPGPLRVAFDPGNGTAGVLLERLFAGTPVEPHYINLTPDGNFPAHAPDPTVAKNVRQLSALTREIGADCGIGYDGDSDRIGAVDERGEMVFGDKLLGIFATPIVKTRPGAKIVFEVKCSQGLVEYLESIGGRPLMWKTGHSLIKAKMKEDDAPLAGEMSGHMFFADDYYGYDDALYATLRLLKLLAETGRKLSELAAAIPAYFSTPEIRVTCPDELKFRIVEELRDGFRREYEVLDIDGARVQFGDGWGLVRASNTGPVLVLRFEARTPERLAEIRGLFQSRLEQYPGLRLPAD